jgi:hypothetical protein
VDLDECEGEAHLLLHPLEPLSGGDDEEGVVSRDRNEADFMPSE